MCQGKCQEIELITDITPDGAINEVIAEISDRIEQDERFYDDIMEHIATLHGSEKMTNIVLKKGLDEGYDDIKDQMVALAACRIILSAHEHDKKNGH